MSELKHLTCVCCGAPINRVTQRCEYCGTEYVIENGVQRIRFESFQNPVKEYKACMFIDEYCVEYGGKEYIQSCIEQLAKELLPGVIEGMTITKHSDPFKGMQKLEGKIKMVIPKNKADMEVAHSIWMI